MRKKFKSYKQPVTLLQAQHETATQIPLVGLLDRVQAQFVFMVLLFITPNSASQRTIKHNDYCFSGKKVQQHPQ